MQNFTSSLHQHQLKATPQRIAIATVLHSNGHMSIDALYESMKKEFISLSLATIYKNITIMIANNFIAEVKIPNSKSVYELTKTSHSHLVCSGCGAIEDVLLDLSGYFSLNPIDSGFIATKAELVLSGICHKCQK